MTMLLDRFGDMGLQMSPVEIDGAEFDLDADMIIKALGFEPEDQQAMFGAPDLKVTARGTLRVDPETLETSVAGVYAAGDIVRGASLVVWAVVDGRKAAAAIATRLKATATTPIAAE